VAANSCHSCGGRKRCRETLSARAIVKSGSEAGSVLEAVHKKFEARREENDFEEGYIPAESSNGIYENISNDKKCGQDKNQNHRKSTTNTCYRWNESRKSMWGPPFYSTQPAH